MDNKRGLFITDIISKLYEKVIKNRNNEKINAYISDQQAGGVKGKSTIDNIIVLNEIIRRNRKLGYKTYIHCSHHKRTVHHKRSVFRFW